MTTVVACSILLIITTLELQNKQEWNEMQSGTIQMLRPNTTILLRSIKNDKNFYGGFTSSGGRLKIGFSLLT